MKISIKKLLPKILLSLVLIVFLIGIFQIITHKPSVAPNPIEPLKISETPKPATPEKIDFQPMIDTWLKTARGQSGIMIYDLDNNALVGSHNPDKSFRTASLYKLFVVYEGYLRREAGTLDGTAKLVGNYTIDQCLDLAIRESNSTCGEAFLAKFRPEINAKVASWGLENSSATGLLTTPADMLKMLQIYYNHDGLSAETWAVIQDSMLNQPPSAGLCAGPCNWRQGLPSGFSENVKVYNKVGWESSGSGGLWNLYHDTAIVEFPNQNRHYIVILLTTNSYLKDVKSFATSFENYLNTQ